MKNILFVAALMLLGFMTGNAWADAITLHFFGDSDQGSGSAVMGLQTDDNELTVSLKNTSPILTTDGHSSNAPGISWFGFTLQKPIAAMLDSWQLEAQIVDNNGDSSPYLFTGGYEWSQKAPGSRLQGEGPFDFLFEAEKIGPRKNWLYNPAVLTDSEADLAGKDPYYFTEAILNLSFSEGTDLTGILHNVDSLVRMQNVGTGGEGSLKLAVSHTGAPEPGTLILWTFFGVGICSVWMVGRRRRHAL